MKTFGIDVSRYQERIYWEKVKAAGVKFALLKTVSTNKSFGGLYIDPQFERNYAECKRLGIAVGAYYYTYAQTVDYAKKELALFKKAISGKQFEFPLIVDVEENLLKPLSRDALTNLVVLAAETIQSWGCFAQVYTYSYYKQTELDMARLAKYSLWIADYRGNRPVFNHDIWQYSSSGHIDGINKPVDLNWCYVDFPAIIKKAGLNGFGKAPVEKPKLYNVIVGPMTNGDKNAFVDHAETLQVGHKVEEVK